MPLKLLTASSIGSATLLSIVSGSAPGYTTVIVTIGKSTLGNRSTDSRLYMTAPNTRIASMIIAVKIGRLIETSESFTTYLPFALAAGASSVQVGCAAALVPGSAAGCCSAVAPSLTSRFHARAIAQATQAVAHDRVTFFDALEHLDGLLSMGATLTFWRVDRCRPRSRTRSARRRCPRPRSKARPGCWGWSWA